MLEIRPPVRIDKGAGIVACCATWTSTRRVYVGDDVTDLDAFRGLDELVETERLRTAIRVGVRSDEEPSALRDARPTHMVDGTDGVRDLLRALTGGARRPRCASSTSSARR